ncbi:hypothetical protein AALO_G00285560 [Alosa alosa]|uniref:Sema domain-containing protein n=1 Tax=Alosa alosa TaxID=278164 RepID=A0AAV6FK62_9TELE|nr:hypothetical protein AALO_G00285560 [Alosa alosa]
MTAVAQTTPSYGPSLLLLLLPLVLSQNPLHSSKPDLDSETSPSEECNRRQHPIVSFPALSPWLSSFSAPGVNDYSQLALDLSRNQLIVGARNYLFSLSLSNVSLLQATEWAVDADTRRSCQSKGKTEEECQNYIRVLLLSGKKVFTCGTNAFTPVCSTRQIGNLSKVLDHSMNGGPGAPTLHATPPGHGNGSRQAVMAATVDRPTRPRPCHLP